MEIIAPYIIKELAEKHILRYKSRIDSGRRDVRTEECKAYLELWQSITNKDYVWKHLTAVEKLEVEDAMFDELSGA